MPFPKSLQQPFRKSNLLIGAGWRGFFAPFNAALNGANNSTSLGPNILDLQVQGPFNENSLPVGYTDLGWINGFKIAPGSKIGQVRSGYRGAVRAQYRGEVGETFDFTFRESTRMAWKISTGTEIFNLLSNPQAAASTLGPLSSSGTLAVALSGSGYLAAGYTPPGLTAPQPSLYVTAGAASGFAVGQYIVCDIDYVNTLYGITGSGGVPIFQNAVNDVDFLRKISDFVSGISGIYPGVGPGGTDVITLNQPFVGGGNNALVNTSGVVQGPGPNAKIQVVKGWAAREGGTYITEWSGLFTTTMLDGSQIAIYYPHISANQFKEIGMWAPENQGTTDQTGYELSCSMTALAFDDPLDGETVVRYCAFFPSANKQISI